MSTAAAPLLAAPSLGAYLKDRRTRLDPAAFGVSTQRRRTPGLRREEVAQRAHISATWYTWLEQGRGGAPAAEVLERIAQALMLTDAEREHLFLLGLGRPPQLRETAAEGISPRLQRVLDALEASPAYVKTSTWDLLAWNRAAAAVFGYDRLPPEQRNILRRIFGAPEVRAMQFDWESVARFVVAAFRADAARSGKAKHVTDFVDEMCRTSAEFTAMWHEHDVRYHGEGTKRIRHPQAGPLTLEYSAFSVDGRPELGMVVFNPATPADARRIRTLIEREPKTL